MNRMLSAGEILELESTATVVTMTRREKLLRWASLVREWTAQIGLYHGLEYRSKEWLNGAGIGGSAFAVATSDPILTDAGYKPTSVGDAMKFFELSQSDLHEFSCDCGGSINNKNMADRIEKLAGPAPVTA